MISVEHSAHRNVGSDEELMSAFYQCSEGAFNTLTLRWWPRLFGYFQKLGFGTEESEDLALDVLVKLYLTKEKLSFDTRLPLAPFLFTIARRLAVGEWRRRQREVPPVPFPSDLEAVPAEGESQIAEDLLLCVRALPEPEQTYVMLCGRHGLGDLSHNEIATVLEKWPAQVTQLSKRARTQLKDCLTGKGYG